MRWSLLLVVGLAACGIDALGEATVVEQAEGDAGAMTDVTKPDVTRPSDDASEGDGAAPPGDAAVDAPLDTGFDAGPEPPTILTPFAPTGELTYQRTIDWTIAALDPAASIRYTTNGTSPLLAGALTATGKVTLTDVANNTTIQWSAGASSVVHSFIVKVNGGLSSSTHTIVDRVSFDPSGSPFAKVAAGATVTGHARFFMWNAPTGCPSCIDQILVGVTMSEDCIASANPGTYPGDTGTNIAFTFKAPATPGTYKVKTGFRQEYKCSPDAIDKPLGTTEIGTIVVE